MVIYDIDERAGIEAISFLKYGFSKARLRMRVCKGVNGPVQGDAFLDGWRIIEFLPAFYKIADQIAYGNFGYAEGKPGVRQVVHPYNLMKKRWWRAAN